MTFSLETKAKLACLYAGACWGLFWLPLRNLEHAGLHSLWITVVYFLIPAACLLPVLILRWRHFWSGGVNFQITVIASGIALTLYSTSIVYTEVVRAILLFYLMPIWSTLLARWYFGELITPIRVVAIVMAICGMLVIFDLGLSFPLPRNAGDWMGLGGGVFWAVTMVRLRSDEGRSSIDLTVGFFLWSLILSGGVALIMAPSEMPSLDVVLPTFPLLLVFMAFLIVPGTYASLWGPKFLNPGIVGLLFMTELVVGAISVALLAGEPFGVRELTGVILVAVASLLEPARDVYALHAARSAVR